MSALGFVAVSDVVRVASECGRSHRCQEVVVQCTLCRGLGRMHIILIVLVASGPAPRNLLCRQIADLPHQAVGRESAELPLSVALESPRSNQESAWAGPPTKFAACSEARRWGSARLCCEAVSRRSGGEDGRAQDEARPLEPHRGGRHRQQEVTGAARRISIPLSADAMRTSAGKQSG